MLTDESAATKEPPLRILLVEDDDKLSSVLQRALRGQGHDVAHVPRGDLALQVATSPGARFDVIVLDVMLPGVDGVTVCRRLRASGVAASIIMLTARASIDDRVTGLDAGADDYLVKPFALKELYARIRASRRRAAHSSESRSIHSTASAASTGDANSTGERLTVGSLTLRPDIYGCERHGQTIELRPKEYEVLEHLMRNAGIVVRRADLLDAAWGFDADHRSNAIDAQILRLRSKIDRPFGTNNLVTRRGVGFCFVPDDDTD